MSESRLLNNTFATNETISGRLFQAFMYNDVCSRDVWPGFITETYPQLEMNGELIATHPGSPRSYKDPSYRYCHSTRSHNVVTVDLANHALSNKFAPGGKLRSVHSSGKLTNFIRSPIFRRLE